MHRFYTWNPPTRLCPWGSIGNFEGADKTTPAGASGSTSCGPRCRASFRPTTCQRVTEAVRQLRPLTDEAVDAEIADLKGSPLETKFPRSYRSYGR